VVAAGASHAYFGHDEWAPVAPGLKTIEDATEIRRRICADLDFLGITADPARNDALTDGKEGEFGTEGARVRLFVIPTNEELLIARDTVRCILDAPRRW